jgi:thiamine pyrophosphokinase
LILPKRRSVRRTGLRALILANGSAPDRDRLPAGTLDGIDLVVAADGGLLTAQVLGIRPDLAVGDFDSADPVLVAKAEAEGVAIERVAAEKDESDLELAVRAAVARGATSIAVVGALGGTRIEHTLAGLALLGLDADGGRSAIEMSIIDERSTVRLLAGESRDGRTTYVDLDGEPGDYISLQPWGGDATGVSTKGLRYPLHDEPLRMGPSRGLSNELLGRHGRVSCRSGQLLVIHTRRAAVEAARANTEVSS